MEKITGYVSSFQTLGAVDGPGIRFVVFLQGCPLRCVCCHNPETQSMSGGNLYSAEDIVQKAKRYKDYFGDTGGITLSGGDPLAQPEFAAEILRLCKQNSINTCLDTSGYALNDKIKEVLKYTDLVLLDIKYTNENSYLKYAGCKMSAVIQFLEYLQQQQIPVWIRQVIIPGLNDNEENISALREIVGRYKCVKKTELLPFRKLCETKYDNMGRPFPLKGTPEPTDEKMRELQNILNRTN
ncbi:MAG: pyruvate formate-lyase-activating protein [Acutalibacteraceae bacterium]|jgi:pyruvate formate lyase activating enzyme